MRSRPSPAASASGADGSEKLSNHKLGRQDQLNGFQGVHRYRRLVVFCCENPYISNVRLAAVPF
jgi:hypothetical protein